MDKLIKQINKYIKLYLLDKKIEHPHTQQLICKEELYAYFSVLIYIGITIELYIKDYWKDLTIYSTKHIIMRYMGIV